MKHLIKLSFCILLPILYAVPLTCVPRHYKINQTVDKSHALKAILDALMRDLRNDIPALRLDFDNKVKGFKTSPPAHITADYEHILGIDLQFSPHGTIKIGGFHHDFNNRIENSGTLKFIRKACNKKGFYRADILYQGRYITTKNFFPAHWSRKTVMRKIYEAYNNFIKSGAHTKLEPSGNYTVNGITHDGVTIRMYITKQGKIRTAFPMI